MKDFYSSYINREYSFMNKAFIAICFWQSLPDLPPLGRHVPLTAFYRLVKAELYKMLLSKQITFIEA